MASYLRPKQLQEALDAISVRPRTLLTGGTDHYPARAVHEAGEDILDLSAIEDLGRIERSAGLWRIPALTTWTGLVESALPPLFDGLKQAARQVGGRQVQNAGTLAGNVCNASPAADGIPALLALDAVVELRSAGSIRTVPLDDFVLGPRRTARRADEIVTGLLIPHRDAQSQFLKLGGRRYLVISISMVALTLETDRAGCVTHAAIAVGACGPRAMRLPALEAALVGETPSAHLVQPEHLAPLTPIDDVRASAAYRLDATIELLRRGLARPLAAAA